MKKIMISAALFLATLNFNASAQNVTVGYIGGYGTYAMGDMKDLLQLAKNEMPVEGKIINNFPGYINHSIQAGYLIKKHHFGLEYGLLSTGGKVDYSDYSGYINGEINLKTKKFGLFYKYHFYNQEINKNKLSFFASLSPGVMFSKMDVVERSKLHIPVETTEYSDNFKFESRNYYVLPQLGINYNFMKYFSIHASAGYELGINQAIELKSADFENAEKSNNKIDWSGLRAGIGFTILFPTK